MIFATMLAAMLAVDPLPADAGWWGKVLFVNREGLSRQTPETAAKNNVKYENLTPSEQSNIESLLSFIRGTATTGYRIPDDAPIQVSTGEFKSSEGAGSVSQSRIELGKLRTELRACEFSAVKSLGRAETKFFGMSEFTCPSAVGAWKKGVVGFSFDHQGDVDFIVNNGDLPNVKIGGERG